MVLNNMYLAQSLESELSADVALRPAAQHDRLLCETLFIEQHQRPLVLAGWNDAQCRHYLQSQFTMREQHLATQYPCADHYMIVAEENEVGRMLINRQQNQIQIVDMALLASWCGRGIGAYLLSELCREADETKKPLALQVACDNPAQRLYSRFGFEMNEELDKEQGVYLNMRRAVAL